MSRPCRILVVGGYGHFGGRICRALAASPGVTLVVAGRDESKAQSFAQTLDGAHAGVALDHTAADLAARLRSLAIDVVVHAGGPFQGQDYHVARACVAAAAHYIDLADGRAFVVGITGLDEAARAGGVLVASGASTVPALSSAIVDEHLTYFSRLETIDISIAPGQQTPRGVATLEGVLSYCGKPFEVWEDGRWQIAHGWQDVHYFRYPDFGARWLARCDVPDLLLFPARYPQVRRVRFDAGLELVLAQAAFWLLATAVRLRLVNNADRFACFLQTWGSHFDGMGSDVGGMHVGLSGMDHDGQAAHRLAPHGAARPWPGDTVYSGDCYRAQTRCRYTPGVRRPAMHGVDDIG